MEDRTEKHFCPSCKKLIDAEDVHRSRTVNGQVVQDHVHCRGCGARSVMVGDESGVVLRQVLSD